MKIQGDLLGDPPNDRVGQPQGWRQQQAGNGELVTVEGKETSAVEGEVLYGPVADSTAYCQVTSPTYLALLQPQKLTLNLEQE